MTPKFNYIHDLIITPSYQDVIIASVKAYIDAINKVTSIKRRLVIST